MAGRTRNPQGQYPLIAREVYRTSRGMGLIASERPRGPYTVYVQTTGKVTVRNGRRKVNPVEVSERAVNKSRVSEARAWLRAKLGPLRKATNPGAELSAVVGAGRPSPNPLRPGFADSLEREGEQFGREYLQRVGPDVAADLDADDIHRLASAQVDLYAREYPFEGNERRAAHSYFAYGMRKGVYGAGRGGYRGPGMERGASMGWGSRRNPSGPITGQSQSDVLYEEFHGKAPTQTTLVRRREVSRDHLAKLGVLTELKVKSLSGKTVKLPFPAEGRDSVLLCSSPDGKQLYFEGGDQSVNLRDLGMSGPEWVRDSMALGILEQVTYRTRKGFDQFQLIDYYHKLGEESGMEPILTYDTLNHTLSVAGGQYEVRPEGIVN